MPLTSTTKAVPIPKPKQDIQDLIIGQGRLTPVIFRLAGPVVLMMYLQGAYNIIDTIWVGQLLGKLALAGIATGGFVLWSILGLTSLVSVGVTAMLARRIGANEIAQAEQIALKGLWYAFAVSLVVGSVIWVLAPSLFRLMGSDPAVRALGEKYLRVILCGCPFIFLSFTVQRIFQSVGDTVTPMWLMLLSLLLNVVLDPVLMLGLFGFPRLGVAGAALATVIARFLMSLLGISLLLSRKRIGTRRFDHPFLRLLRIGLPTITGGYLRLAQGTPFKWDWALFGSILRIGLPNAVSQTLFPVVYMIITRLPAAYGPKYIAALRIGHTVEGVSFFLALGFSMAAATCVGQNLGAKKPERAARSGWIAAGIVSLILSIFSVLFFVIPSMIGAVFSPDQGTIQASATYLRILALSQVFMGIEIVLVGAFSGAGDTVPPLAYLAPLNVARIPLAYLLAGTAGFGINGVWWAISGTSILKGLVIAWLFYRGGWKRKMV
jgi:Na+-driven multidrug efflux pump